MKSFTEMRAEFRALETESRAIEARCAQIVSEVAEIESGRAADVICNTCGKPDYAPYRRYSPEGRITEGCVDACHSGRLVTPSASADWHNRKAAKEIRALTAKRLAGRK